jgi:hypothetical protein
MTQLTNILNLAVQITDKTKYDAFFRYSGHVNYLHVDICEKNDAIFELIYNKICKITNTKKLTKIETDLTTFLNENTK